MAQATAAERAGRAFWTALSTNSARAVERTVVPAQRSCVAGFLQGSGFKFKISSLRITAAKPARTSDATVWSLGERDGANRGPVRPDSPPGATRTTWLQATEVGSTWYADLGTQRLGCPSPVPMLTTN